MIDMPSSNHLLNWLGSTECDILKPCLNMVELPQGAVLAEHNQPATHAYFLTSGMAATVMGETPDQQVEVGMIGREGLVGLPIVLGVAQCPRRTLMLVSGTGYRVAAKALESVMDARPEVRKVLLAYVHTYIIQVSTSAYANSRLTVEQRLARWMLMSQDRLGDDLRLTHVFYAMVLGVRRPGVTVATHVLEGLGLIKAKRASILIKDREGLREFAGRSYGPAETEYRRVFGTPQEGPSAASTLLQMAV